MCKKGTKWHVFLTDPVTDAHLGTKTCIPNISKLRHLVLNTETDHKVGLKIVERSRAYKVDWVRFIAF